MGSAQFGSFSAWDKAHVSQSLEKVKTHLKHCCELYKLQMDEGNYFVHEFPWEPSGWYSDSVSKLLQDPRVICLPVEQNGLRTYNCGLGWLQFSYEDNGFSYKQ